jgi:hypothetical protein
MMNNIAQSVAGLFTPLDKSYCDLLYILAVVQFIFFIVLVATLVSQLLGDFKKHKYHIIASLVMIGTLGIQYIYYRLLYGMCVKSL